MADPPGQAVLDDVGNIAPPRGDTGDRRDMIDLQRVLHAQEKPKPENSKHAVARPHLSQRSIANFHAGLKPLARSESMPPGSLRRGRHGHLNRLPSKIE
jgi:hypothetical protein